MKTALRFAALCLALSASAALAQSNPTGATPTQQIATDLQSSVACTTASGTAQQTITLTPPGGQYVYLVTLDLVAVATTAPAATLLTTTTTNLGGMKWYNGITATAGQPSITAYYPPHPLKSATPGTAVTVVSNAAVTNVTYNETACYYYAL